MQISLAHHFPIQATTFGIRERPRTVLGAFGERRIRRFDFLTNFFREFHASGWITGWLTARRNEFRTSSLIASYLGTSFRRPAFLPFLEHRRLAFPTDFLGFLHRLRTIHPSFLIQTILGAGLIIQHIVADDMVEVGHSWFALPGRL